MHQGNELARALLVERGQLADVGAADKSALAGAGQHYQPQLRIRGEVFGSFDDLGHQCAIEAVQLRRIVDRQSRETAAFGPFLVLHHHAHRMPLPLSE